MNLGVICRKGKPTNHRSVVKVFCNPIFRLLGFELTTRIDMQTTEIIGREFRRCKPFWSGFWIRFPVEDDCTVRKSGVIL